MNLASPDRRIRLDQDDTTGSITARCADYGHALGGTWPAPRESEAHGWRIDLPAYVEPYVDTCELGAFGTFLAELPTKTDAINSLVKAVQFYLSGEPHLGGHSSTAIAHAFVVSVELADGNPDPADGWDQATQGDLYDYLTLIRQVIRLLAEQQQAVTHR